MARIEITGYIDTSELDEAEVDETSPTGLSEQGYANLINGEDGVGLAVADLHNVDVKKRD